MMESDEDDISESQKGEENTRKRKITTKTQDKGEKKYKQHYRNEWALLPEFSKWLTKGKTADIAYCKVCRCEIQARLATIRIHGQSSKHMSLMNSSSGCSQVCITRVDFCAMFFCQKTVLILSLCYCLLIFIAFQAF